MTGATAASAGQLFQDVFGATAEGLWSAPGRVNLIGEFTDVNDGFVLPIALPLRTNVAVSRSSERRLRVASALGGAVEATELSTDPSNAFPAPRWTLYVLGVVRSLQDAGYDIPGADVAITSEVPIGAGLSSSAALESAIALALSELYELDLERLQLARIARRAENVYVGVPSGIMDQVASLCGAPDHALFLDTRSQEFELVPFDPTAYGLALMIIDTKVAHALASSAYGDRVRECREAAGLLGLRSLRDAHPVDVERVGALPEVIRRRARHVVTENQRVLDVAALLRAEEIDRIGPMLTASHASLRDDFEVSSDELNVAVEAAMASGALGARMTGGGFGGSAICLIDKSSVPEVQESIVSAFTERRFAPPHCFVAVAGGGAARQQQPTGVGQGRFRGSGVVET